MRKCVDKTVIQNLVFWGILHVRKYLGSIYKYLVFSQKSKREFYSGKGRSGVTSPSSDQITADFFSVSLSGRRARLVQAGRRGGG